MSLLVVGSYLWVMMILFGSIVLETADSEPDYFANEQLAEVLGNKAKP